MIRFWVAGFLFCTALAQTPDRIYTNGTILTLNKAATQAQALATAGDKIIAVGTRDELMKLATDRTVVIDLHGKTMLPGFYAAHDHFPSVGHLGLHTADLNSPPIGKIETIADLQAALREHMKSSTRDGWITGRGYDDTLLKEHRHPTRDDLDAVSKDRPMWITHVSGHLGVANSRALAIAGITRDTPKPAGGVIRHDPRTGEPNGVFEESLGLITKFLPGYTREQSLEATAAASDIYLKQGVTTAIIAGGSVDSIAALKRAEAAGVLKLRVRSMRFMNGAQPPRLSTPSELVSIGGVKMQQDGSLQGLTGYLTKPYATGDPNFSGYAMRSREALTTLVKSAHNAGLQIAIHGNGDAAIDDILAAYEAAQKANPRADARHRIEHCQTVREDQLDKMKQLGVTPSFFIGHVYYWGDRHRDLFLGPERAARISPLESARRRAIRFTLHDDTPVTPVNPLLLVWGAVNRQTRDGKLLGPDQRMPVIDALRAVTSEAAWQNFEEAAKGSIEVGKLADFTILSENPLQTPSLKLRDIKVTETIIGGKSRFRLYPDGVAAPAPPKPQ